MSQFTAPMQAALAGTNATIFGAVEILLPGYTLRLLDGAGRVTFAGKTFEGLDPTFGTIDSIDVIADGTGDEAPSVSLTLIPSGDAAAGALASASMQGSQVSMWIGAVDPATGIVIPDPHLFFLGEMDVPVLDSSTGARRLELTIVSAFEKFFMDDEGARLSDTFHRFVWPGETGLASVTGVDQQIYWGIDSPRGTITYGASVSFFGINRNVNRV